MLQSLALVLLVLAGLPASKCSQQAAAPAGTAVLHVTAAKTSDVVKALARHEGDERLEVVLYSRTGVIAVDVPITLDGLTVVTFAAAPGSAVSMQCTSGSKGSRTSSQGPILRLTRDEPTDGSQALVRGLRLAGCGNGALEVEGFDTVRLANLTIHGNGRRRAAHDTEHSGSGGGIWLARVGARAVLEHVRCTDNEAVYGGCLATKHIESLLEIRDSVFSGNTARDQAGTTYDPRAGAASFFQVGSVLIVRTRFTANAATVAVTPEDLEAYEEDVPDASYGGAIEAVQVGNLTVHSSEFVDHFALNQGGVIYAEDCGHVRLVDTLLDNSAHSSQPDALAPIHGGAVYVVGPVTVPTAAVSVEMHGCTLKGFRASTYGGALDVEPNSTPGSITLSNCSFEDNQVSGRGGVMALASAGSGSIVTVRNCTHRSNIAGVAGGAYLLLATTATFSHSLFHANQAAEIGGAIAMEDNSDSLAARTVSFSHCKLDGNSAELFGGALSFQGMAVHMQDTVLAGTQVGGALHITVAPHVELTNVRVHNNKARTGGGGMHAVAVEKITIQGSSFTANKGDNGAALHFEAVSSASLTASELRDNRAFLSGGAVYIIHSGPTVVLNTSLLNNTARLGGAVFADNAALELLACTASGNQAVPAAYPRSDMDTALEFFAAVMELDGSGGAVLTQRGSLYMEGCTLTNNSAWTDAGALLALQPNGTALTNCTFAGNAALGGDAGSLLVRGPAQHQVVVSHCSFSSNTAARASGGALMLDGGLGIVEAVITDSSFHDNRAGQVGGACAAAGDVSISATNSVGAGNKAGTDGGWAFCRGCRVLHTTACTLQGNTARGMGGAVACQDCHSVDAASVSFSSNHAGNGGAVAVASSNYAKGACSVRMSACTFDINTAEPSRDPITSAVLSASQGLSHQLLGCDQEWQGLGGAACIAVAGEAWMSNNTFRGNSADFGGAMFLQSTCYQHQACLVTLADVHADNNTAHLAGSLLYTTSPSNLQAYPAGLLDATASPAIGMQPPVASFPSSFHLQPPRHHGQDHAAAGNSYNGTTAGPLQYTGTTARECGVLPVQPLGEDPFTAVVFTGEVFSLDVFVLDAYGSVVASGPGSEWVLRLEPNQRRTSVDSDPAQLKGSLVATAAQGVARFGNLSVVGSPGSTLQMQVVARNADALSGGMGGQPAHLLSQLITLQLSKCLPGQKEDASIKALHGSHVVRAVCMPCAQAEFSFDASSRVCQACPALGVCEGGMLLPSNHTWHPHPRSSVVLPCPHAASCTRGDAQQQMLYDFLCAHRGTLDAAAVPAAPYHQLQCAVGYTGRLCSACSRPALPGTQQYGHTNNRCVECSQSMAGTVVAFLFARLLDMLLVAGIAALWLVGWLLNSTHVHVKAAPGPASRGSLSFVLHPTSSIVSDAPLAGEGSAAMLAHWRPVACTASLPATPVPAGPSLPGPGRSPSTTSVPAGPSISLGSREVLLGTHSIPVSAQGSMRWGQDIAHQPAHGHPLQLLRSTSSAPAPSFSSIDSALFYRQTASQLSDGPPVARLLSEHTLAEYSMLHNRIRQLHYVSQVLLDLLQIVAVLIGLNILWRTPDWCPAALSGLLITQQHTWQWASIECMLPAGARISPAVVSSITVMLLPVLYVALLLPWMHAFVHVLKHGATSCLGISSMPSPQRGAHQALSQVVAALARLRWRHLVVVLAAAAGSYTFAWQAQAVMGTFQCWQAPAGGGIPGEQGIAGSYWVGDLDLPCWRGPHALLVGLALLVGAPLLLAHLVLLLLLAAAASSTASTKRGAASSAGTELVAGAWRLVNSGACRVAFDALQVAASSQCCWALPAAWWWPAGKELLKLCVIAVSSSLSMRSAVGQLLAVAAAVAMYGLLQWLSVPGRSLRMERQLLVSSCVLQAVAAVLLMLAMPEASPLGVAGTLLVAAALGMAAAAVELAAQAARAASGAAALLAGLDECWGAVPRTAGRARSRSGGDGGSVAAAGWQQQQQRQQHQHQQESGLELATEVTATAVSAQR